jgi:hypothetical protein
MNQLRLFRLASLIPFYSQFLLDPFLRRIFIVFRFGIFELVLRG